MESACSQHAISMHAISTGRHDRDVSTPSAERPKGSRHSSNILVDKETAELVHIDLGIAFDQGTLLKTPECVPFRLTRDLVDALGVCGVEGPMRGAAEQTMRVLRSNGEALLAILQLIVHNPMHRWAQDEERMQGAQRERAGPAEPLSRAAHPIRTGRPGGAQQGKISKLPECRI